MSRGAQVRRRDEILATLPEPDRHLARRALDRLLARAGHATRPDWCAWAVAALDERAQAGGAGAVRGASADARTEAEHRRTRRLEVEARVALRLADAEAGAAATLSSALAGAWLRAASDASWRLARPAFEALAAHVQARRAGAEVVALVVGLAARRAHDPEAPVWTRGAALAALVACRGADALDDLKRLLEAAASRDDLFVRVAAARLVAQATGGNVARALLAPRLDDPSEHVRMVTAELLGALGDVDALRAALRPERQPSPRVRAAAAIALAPLAAVELASVLLTDPDAIPRRVALEEAEGRAHEHPALRRAIEDLAASAPWPDLARLAAEAAERLAAVSDANIARALAAVRAAAPTLADGAGRRIALDAPEEAIGRALAVLATDDRAWSARPVRGGVEIVRGDRFRRRWWRVAYELRHPSPDKRRSHLHTVGRAPFGSLRAPPGRMAEVTATQVPGERVLAPKLGDWGRHLPAVDDLMERPSSGRLRLFHAFGITEVMFPGRMRWPFVRARVNARYARLVRLRGEALTAAEPRERRAFLDALATLGFEVRFAPHRASPPHVAELFPPAGVPMNGLWPLPLASLVERAFDPAASSVSHLLALSFAAAGLYLVRLESARRSIEGDRASLPLVIGGWGTRGKSGTERLKAALFQSLGAEVLVKTTGCEAMLIHALPDRPAREVFIYRTYDKATIWEQRDLLGIAARLQADVFLWECMGLSPDYVEILQRHWMRDDVSTLTNTYPDHENIQGPAGVDIPRVMGNFLPPGGRVLTAEEQMLPILRDEAAARGTALAPVPWRASALLPSDLLARFPYEEHPRNVALVLALAASLGVDRDVAMKEMADAVVPDLGVLKTYPPARWRGRTLVFSNGMSANERAGFLANWTRLGFDAADPDDVGTAVFTVVNNRDDRVSRSAVFGDIIVNDAVADAHVLIGTNLEGLAGYAEGALGRRIEGVTLFHEDEASRPLADRERLAGERAARALRWVRLGALGPERLLAEARAMAAGLGRAEALATVSMTALTRACGLGATTLAATETAVAGFLAPALAAFAQALGEHGADAVAHLVRLGARHAAALGALANVKAACASAEPGVRARAEASFRKLLADLYRRALHPLPDPGLHGDEIVDALARLSPPGFRVRVMGIQNIKGTGLDFAYRWVAWDRTHAACERLGRAHGDEARGIAEGLALQEDMGVLDLRHAEEAVQLAAARRPEDSALAAAAARLGARRLEREAALGRRAANGFWAGVRRRVWPVLDVYDGIARRRVADRLVADLVAGRISRDEAAVAARNLGRRAKGG